MKISSIENNHNGQHSNDRQECMSYEFIDKPNRETRSGKEDLTHELRNQSTGSQELPLIGASRARQPVDISVKWRKYYKLYHGSSRQHKYMQKKEGTRRERFKNTITVLMLNQGSLNVQLVVCLKTCGVICVNNVFVISKRQLHPSVLDHIQTNIANTFTK